MNTSNNSSFKMLTIKNILDNKKNKFPIIKKNEVEKNRISNNNKFIDTMIRFNYNIIKDIKKNFWGKKLINEYSDNELSLNNFKRPLLLSPNIMSSKKYRERKNIFNKKNNKDKIDYEKLIISKIIK